MNKQQLQSEVDARTKKLNRISTVKKMAEMRLESARSKHEELLRSRGTIRAEIAMGMRPKGDMDEVRSDIAKCVQAMNELPDEITCLGWMAEAARSELDIVSVQLQELRRDEAEALKLAEFVKFKDAHWKGCWDTLKSVSALESEEFDRMRELYARKHGL